MSNIHIYGLVTRGSPIQTNRKPFQASGLVITEVAGYRPFLRWSPARVRSPERAFAFDLHTPQSGLANGPTWAALKKHRMPRKGELKRLGACRGPVLEANQPNSRTNRKRLEVGTQGRACGVRQPLLNRQVSIKSFWYQVKESKISRGGFKPTPALGDL